MTRAQGPSHAEVGEASSATDPAAHIAQPDHLAQIAVTRTSAHEYHVKVGPVRYTIVASTRAGADPRAMDVGQFRLLRATWTDDEQVEHPIISCGQCHLIDSLSADGVRGAWAGGGHGNDGARVVGQVHLDDEPTEIPPGRTMTGLEIRFVSSSVLQSSNRAPLQSLEVEITINRGGLLHESRATALVDHYRHLRYEDMLATDVVDYFDTWSVHHGETLIQAGGNDPCVARNAYIPRGTRTRFDSSRLGIRLKIETRDSTDGDWMIQRRANCQRKAYHRVQRSVSPVPRGDVRETSSVLTITPLRHPRRAGP